MNRINVIATSMLAILGVVGSASAHHSFAAEFDINKPITLTGTLTKFEWSNPHGWLYMDVKDASGKVSNWAVEAGAPNALLRQGLRKTDFPPGSKIVMKGYQAKAAGAKRANAVSITFEDGRNFFMGSQAPGAATPPK